MFKFFSKKDKNNSSGQNGYQSIDPKPLQPASQSRLLFEGSEVKGCTEGMVDLVIPDGVTAIWSMAFYDIRKTLRTVVLPESIDCVRANTFQDCPNLVSVTLPSSIRSIRTKAFANCVNLREINLPDGIVDLADDAFLNCPRLVLPKKKASPKAASGIGMAASFKKIPEKTAYSGTVLIQGGYDTPAGLVVPQGVSDIGRGAYAFFGVTSVVLPEGLESIGDGAFSLCDNMKSIRLPSTLKTIGEDAFSCCGSLEEINFPPSLSFVGKGAFNSCKKLVLPNYIKELMENPGSANAPAVSDGPFPAAPSVPAPPAAPRTEAVLTNMAIRDNVLIKCGDVCGKTVIIPNGVEAINHSAFMDMDIEEVYMPDTVTVIGRMAFANCRNLRRIRLSEKLVRVAEGAFKDCESLEHIELPKSLEYISPTAFDGCAKLMLSAAAASFMGKLGELDEIVAIFHSSGVSCRLVKDNVLFVQPGPEIELYVDVKNHIICVILRKEAPKYKECGNIDGLKKGLFELPMGLYI